MIMMIMMMMIMLMMMMMMMIMIIIAVTQSIFKLGRPDFAWKQIQIISNIYNDDDDDDDDGDDDDKDAFICKSVNFKVRTSKFCMEIDLDNI